MASKRARIWYKDTWAMPGSELHEHLENGDMKKAEQCYRETEERHKRMMARIESQEEQNGSCTRNN